MPAGLMDNFRNIRKMF